MAIAGWLHAYPGLLRHGGSTADYAQWSANTTIMVFSDALKRQYAEVHLAVCAAGGLRLNPLPRPG